MELRISRQKEVNPSNTASETVSQSYCQFIPRSGQLGGISVNIPETLFLTLCGHCNSTPPSPFSKEILGFLFRSLGQPYPVGLDVQAAV